MQQPAFDIWIRLVDSLAVAELTVKHVTAERQCCRPCDIIVVVVPEGGCHIAEHPVLTLRLTDVTHPLGIKAFVVEEEALA